MAVGEMNLPLTQCFQMQRNTNVNIQPLKWKTFNFTEHLSAKPSVRFIRIVDCKAVIANSYALKIMYDALKSLL